MVAIANVVNTVFMHILWLVPQTSATAAALRADKADFTHGWECIRAMDLIHA